jgi:hypothetical protein
VDIDSGLGRVRLETSVLGGVGRLGRCRLRLHLSGCVSAFSVRLRALDNSCDGGSLVAVRCALDESDPAEMPVSHCSNCALGSDLSLLATFTSAVVC